MINTLGNASEKITLRFLFNDKEQAEKFSRLIKGNKKTLEVKKITFFSFGLGVSVMLTEFFPNIDFVKTAYKILNN